MLQYPVPPPCLPWRRTPRHRVLRQKLKASPEQIDAVESLLRDQTVVAKPARTLDVAIRDKDDAWVLASAVAGEAAILVTGDSDLLIIAAKAPLPILTPRAAWELLRRPGAPQRRRPLVAMRR